MSFRFRLDSTLARKYNLYIYRLIQRDHIVADRSLRLIAMADRLHDRFVSVEAAKNGWAKGTKTRFEILVKIKMDAQLYPQAGNVYYTIGVVPAEAVFCDIKLRNVFFAFL